MEEVTVIIKNSEQTYKELITLGEDGIRIHRENFPDFKPDDFVKEFCNILETQVKVKFEVDSDAQIAETLSMDEE